MQQTLDLALELNCEFANFYSAMAYPGSALYLSAVEQGLTLPAAWDDFSQHGYNTRPLDNNFASARDILGFRDRAFTAYFTHQPYLDLVREKFGQEVVDHVGRMVAMPLPRKLLEDGPA